MARQKIITTSEKKPKTRPASSPEAREKQLISLAYDLAEERLKNGSATSQEIVHFLRLGSMKERKELELLSKKIELDTAKTEEIRSTKRIEDLYANAISAFKSYRGEPEEEDDDDSDLY